MKEKFNSKTCFWRKYWRYEKMKKT